jgi:hypothetical protein
MVLCWDEIGLFVFGVDQCGNGVVLGLGMQQQQLAGWNLVVRVVGSGISWCVNGFELQFIGQGRGVCSQQGAERRGCH